MKLLLQINSEIKFRQYLFQPYFAENCHNKSGNLIFSVRWRGGYAEQEDKFV